jgi:hypothetical protein
MTGMSLILVPVFAMVIAILAPVLMGMVFDQPRVLPVFNRHVQPPAEFFLVEQRVAQFFVDDAELGSPGRSTTTGNRLQHVSDELPLLEEL